MRRPLDTRIHPHPHPHPHAILIDEKEYPKLHHTITESSLACDIQHSESFDHIHEGGLRSIKARLPR